MNVSTFEQVARDLAGQGQSAVRRGRGALSPVMNAAAADAERTANAVWANPTVSPGMISGRLARDRSELAGFIIGDGRGGFFQEVGSAFQAPQPVLGPALERALGSATEAIADEAGRLA